MLSGELYDASDPQLSADRHRARLLFQQINGMNDDEKAACDKLFYELFGEAGEGLWIEPPFYCDYGSNIKLGKNVFMNFGCCILDVMEVTIGDKTMFAPNVQIYTATHPMNAKERSSVTSK